MSKKLLLTLLLVSSLRIAFAQTLFDETIQIPAGYTPTTFVMPPSPLTTQILFVGGTDTVETTATYGNPAGKAVAKEWHDFIGFTPDNTGQSLGWVSVNHEMITRNDKIGDGGGMTAFRVARKEDGSLEVVNQTLNDGRSGKFFNVDFANTVGETGMNCGGIVSMVDGRIWTAEEWFRTNNASIISGVRDTSNWTVQSDIQGWNGVSLKRYQNFNWMVEIDPRQARAIRKQYNWARQGFEGGVVEPGNRIVYLGVDDTPGYFGMFVANTPGDFTRGTLFAYKHDKQGYNWVPIWENGAMLDHFNVTGQKGCTMYNRIEWVTLNPYDNNIYMTETGADKPGNLFKDGTDLGAVFAPHHVARAQAQGFASPLDPNYADYYGRVLRYNPVTDEVTVHIEGGPSFASSPAEAVYPEKHLANPDGISVVTIQGKNYLLIQEDLNGTSFGRTPAGVSNRLCEAFLLDLDIQNPTINDLVRLAAVPAGAEITGGIMTPDGKSILINSQHPSTSNPFPYNHSLTIAINGFDKLGANKIGERNPFTAELTAGTANEFSVYPNPTARIVYFNQATDVALYDQSGKRVAVKRNVSEMDVTGLTPGIYYIRNAAGTTLKLSIQ
jgi:uncharacterized protein